jgi:hypothetical protein
MHRQGAAHRADVGSVAGRAQRRTARALRRTQQQLRACTPWRGTAWGFQEGLGRSVCAGVCTLGAHELEQSRSSISASSPGGPAHPLRPLQQCAPARACVREREHACVSAVCVLVSLNACACATSVRDLC